MFLKENLVTSSLTLFLFNFNQCFWWRCQLDDEQYRTTSE